MARAHRILKPFFEDIQKLSDEELIEEYQEMDSVYRLTSDVQSVLFKPTGPLKLLAPDPSIKNKLLYYWLNRFLAGLERIVNNTAEHRDNLLAEFRRRGVNPPG